MNDDPRTEAAAYYDLNPIDPGDVAFYENRITSADAEVLELGCGTGRILVPLARRCRYIHGIDSSEAMLEICRAKLGAASIPESRAAVELGEVTRFSLGKRFDLIIAPWVFQSLRADEEVRGFFSCIREHLKPGGSGIVNAFRPDGSPDALRREWRAATEELRWEARDGSHVVTCHCRKGSVDPDELVLFPELIFRRYADGDLKHEARLQTVVRCYYPEQLLQLLTDQGFEVTGAWGGYAEEPYGSGQDLVIQFAQGT